MHKSLVQLVNGAQLGLGNPVGAAEVESRHLFGRGLLRMAPGGRAEQSVDLLL
jgi:hypothetical protein